MIGCYPTFVPKNWGLEDITDLEIALTLTDVDNYPELSHYIRSNSRQIIAPHDISMYRDDTGSCY